jgi:alkanesulfonate monooxygenase SsuD/methylene tetrahydromethanopterin reductase-like flavin-dependent oxidoreductase (luciferase family)
MKVGLVAPIMDEGVGVPSWTRLLDIARRAEDGGIDALWVIDHLIFRYPDRPEYGIHEASVIFAALAAVTKRVELGTLVLSTSFRPPAVLAKMAATIDAIAGGRLILGLGCGWHEPEYKTFGFPFDHRVGRFEEAMAVIAPLVRGERVTLAGRWIEVHDCVLLPPPERHIPIMIAAKGERMLRLTAQYAQAWNAAWFGHPNARYHARVADLHAACEIESRDPATIDITVGIEVDNGDPGDRTGLGEHLPADPSAIADALGEWAALGVAHVQLNSGPIDDRVVDIMLEGARRFRAASASNHR